MRRSNRFEDENNTVDINISPLIDMMFLLLIFFIVTATFVQESGVEINRPQSASSDTLDKKSIMIGIDETNKCFIAGKEVGVRDIRTIVSSMLKNDKRPVVLIADEKSFSGKIIEVIDECKIAGAQSVSVATEEK